MSGRTPAEIAQGDQHAAAATETTAYVEALAVETAGRFTVTDSVEKPAWFRNVMMAFAEGLAGIRRVNLCAHMNTMSPLAVPGAVWAETPDQVACLACDRERLATTSRYCYSCAAQLADIGGVMQTKILGALAISAAWCPSCPAPTA